MHAIMTSSSPSSDLTIDDARLALEQHVRTTRWGWRDLSRRLDIVSLERSGAFDVVLQSFSEERTVEGAFEPYRNQILDGPDRGRAPSPWKIPLQVPPMFTVEEKHIIRIPHTDEVRTCHVCRGTTRVTCAVCGGDGRVSCSSCSGTGSKLESRTKTITDSQGKTTTETEHYTVSCRQCGGDGRATCSNCSGSGEITCPTCKGHGQLCHFQRMHVLFATRTNSHQIEDTELPDELVGKADGIAIHQEEEVQIEAGDTADNAGGPYRGGNVRVNSRVATEANKLIASHQFNASEKLHRQRLIVRAVPVWEARYRWRKEERKFWVYGTNQLAHAPNYPASPWRVGGAIFGGAGVPASIIAFYASISPSSADRPHFAVAPPPLYLPEPPPPPVPQLVELELAPRPKPTAAPGQVVIELRTHPSGYDVYDGRIKVGSTPTWITVPSTTRPCTASGSCPGGRCVARQCERTKKFRIAGYWDPARENIEVGPSDAPLIEFY